MTTTVTVAALSPGQVIQVKSGTTYTANSYGYITGVALGDIENLINAGCVLLPSPQNAPVLPWAKGRFYGLPPGATLEPLLTVTGTLYAYPIYIPNPISVATLNLNVSTGQTGGAAHLGIYQDAGGYPGALVYDSGAVSAVSTAVATATPATPPVLTPGWYWIASIFTASSTFPSVEAVKTLYTGTISNELGYDTAAHALAASGEAVTGISVAGTYGALPAIFPASATLTLNADTPAVAIGI